MTYFWDEILENFQGEIENVVWSLNINFLSALTKADGSWTDSEKESLNLLLDTSFLSIKAMLYYIKIITRNYNNMSICDNFRFKTI